MANPPARGSTPWDTTLLSYLDFPQSALVRFVDPTNGSDSFNGLAPYRGYATIAAAVSDLQTYAIAHYSATGAGTLGIGKVILLPGLYDVGAGVAVDYRYPVEIVGGVGHGSGLAGHGYAPGTSLVTPPSPVTIYSSSSAATAMITVGSSGAGSVGYGFAMRGVAFRYSNTVNTAMTAIIRMTKTTRPKLEEITGFSTTGSAYDVPLVEHDGGSTGTTDGASFHFKQLVTAGLPLVHIKGGNINRGYIEGGECQFGSGATYPMIWFDGAGWVCTVIGVALEGGASGPAVKINTGTITPYQLMFLNCGGEAGNSTYPFFDVVAGSHCQFLGGGCSTVDGSAGDWIKFSASAYPHRVANSQVSYNTVTGYKARVVDNSDYPATNVVEGLRNGRIYYQKSGAAPTFSAADFPAIPPNGTIVGTTANTTSGEKRLWMVINGSYVSTVVA
jgi:hypothetical protein